MCSGNSNCEISPVNGFDGYFVCRAGKVYTARKGRSKDRLTQPREMRPFHTGRGKYLAVELRRGRGREVKEIHRLVLETFCGPPKPGQECCHNDGDGKNNRLDNLRWDSRVGNQSDREKHGTSNRGQGNPMAKLTPCVVKDVRNRLERGEPQRVIAGSLGMDQSTISNINTGKLWVHVE